MPTEIVDASRVVDSAWEVVERGLNKKEGEWQYGVLNKWRDVNWDDKEQYYELIKHEQVLPKSSFDLLVEDVGNVMAFAAIPSLFGVTGVVFNAITAAGGVTVGYHIVVGDNARIFLGYTYEPTAHTRLKPNHITEQVSLVRE